MIHLSRSLKTFQAGNGTIQTYLTWISQVHQNGSIYHVSAVKLKSKETTVPSLRKTMKLFI